VIHILVASQTRLGKDVTFKSLGSKTLKGFDDSIRIELVEWRE